MGILDIISSFVLDGNYIFTKHVADKLNEINQERKLYLTSDDVLVVLLSGKLIEVLDNDKRGRRYLIAGTAMDNIMELEISCRIEGNLIMCMSRIISNIHCDNCDSLTETKKVDNVKFARFGQEFIADDMLAEVCPNCGETYYYGLEFTAVEKKIRHAVLPKVA